MVKSLNARVSESLRNFRSLAPCARCAALSRLFLSLFFFDCAWSGGGRYLAVCGMTPRMLLGLLAAVFALPVFFRDLDRHRRNPALFLLLAFWIWAAVCAVRGIRAGNRSDVLLSDLKGFTWFFLLPVCTAVLCSKPQLHRLLDFVLAGSLLQAVLSLACNVACAMISGLAVPLGEWTLALQFGTVSPVSDSLFRIFFYSSPYLILSCAILVFRQARQFRLTGALATALCFSALVLTFTRSLYGAAFVAAALAILLAAFLCRRTLRPLAAHLLASAVLVIVLLGIPAVLFQTSYVNFALSRSLGREITISPAAGIRGRLEESFHIDLTMPGMDAALTDAERQENRQKEAEYLQITSASDERRAITERELLTLIQKNPVAGSGLGAAIPSRESGLDELFYLDMICRTGILGLLLYLAPLVWLLFDVVRKLRCADRDVISLQLSILCGLAAFLVASGFNPWMNAVLGIAWYSLAAALPGIDRDTPSAEKKKELCK